MPSENQKKGRSANYSEKEKIILFNLVKKHKDVIENTKSDAQSTEAKNIAWTKIASEFNSNSPSLVFRSHNSLKMFYKNKKHEIRSKTAENKKEIFLTGGGSYREKPMNGTEELLLSIMDKSTVYGTENRFDSDANTPQKKSINGTEHEATYQVNLDSDIEVFQEESFNEAENVEIIDGAEGTNEIYTEVQNTSKNKNWGKYCANDLKVRPSSPLLRKKGKTKEVGAASKCQPKRLNVGRRRPNTVVKALTSSDLAKKYDILMEKRFEIAELTKQSLLLDIEAKKIKINEEKKNKEEN